MLPGAPNANVTDALAANVPVELSDASPQPEDVPFRDIVPVKDEPVLLVTVRNPESGLAHARVAHGVRNRPGSGLCARAAAPGRIIDGERSRPNRDICKRSVVPRGGHT